MKSNRKQLVAFIFTLFFLLPTKNSKAYCLNGNYWPDDLPVWVVTSGGNSVSNTGLSVNTALNYIKSAIQEWNEASGFNRSLYFAGEVSSTEHGSPGVTIYVTGCSSSACGAAPNLWYGCTMGGVDHINIALFPTGCASRPVTWGVTPPADPDLQGVVAHELGHAIGLSHSDEICSTSEDGTTIGIMRSWFDSAATWGTWRSIRRDDINGIRDIYGARTRIIFYRESTSPTASVWSEENFLLAVTRTPVTATDPNTDNDHDLHGIASASINDQVQYATCYWDGCYGSPDIVDSTAAGYTWSVPKIAKSNNRLMVAWLANEPTNDYYMSLRWGIRQTGGAYPFAKYYGPGMIRHKSFGLTYENNWGVFLLSYIDSLNKAHVVTIEPTTGGIISNQPTNRVLHESGGSACEQRDILGWCLSPTSTTGVNGPCLGWIRGYVDDDSCWYYNQEYDYCYYSYSMHELTYDRSSNNAGYVGSFTQANWWAWVYHKADKYTTSSPDNLTWMNTDYWPIGVGAMTRNGSEIKYRAYYGR